MDSKKVNFFAFFMIIVMCAFSIAVGISNRGKNGINGRNGTDGDDGMSSYELAIKNGIISSDMTEVEYLQSLYGKDGSSVTLDEIYRAYLSTQGLTEQEFTFSDFVLKYYNEKFISDSEPISLVEYATQNALRSTVDICYSYVMDDPIIFGEKTSSGFVIDSYYSNYAAYGVSAGSGVIFRYEDTNGDNIDDVAYIVTNYHVVYCSNYSNDDTYRVYYDENTSNYFTATYDKSKVKTEYQRVQGMFGYYYTEVSYIPTSDLVEAPLYTHFLTNYGIYLNGYQYEKYEISASFVGGSAENDIAVLKVERNSSNENNKLIFGSSFKAAEIGESATLTEGKTIIAVGNPLLANTPTQYESNEVAGKVKEIKDSYVDALCLTSTSGEISNLSEYCAFQSLLDSSKVTMMRLIRVSSAINAGNSGGGLYSTDGKLVGIVNGKIASDEYDNVGYAIPIDKASRIANQIIDQCQDLIETRIKITSSSDLGFEAKNGTSNTYYDFDELRWVIKNDVTITKVNAGGYLSNKLEVGDVIKSIEFGGVIYEMNIDYEVDDVLLAYRAGQTLKLNIVRTEMKNGNLVSKSLVVSTTLTSEMLSEVI